MSAYNVMQDSARGVPQGGLLAVPPSEARPATKSQKALHKLLCDVRARATKQRFYDAELDDPCASAYFNRLGSVSASAILRSWPGQLTGSHRASGHRAV